MQSFSLTLRFLKGIAWILTHPKNDDHFTAGFLYQTRLLITMETTFTEIHSFYRAENVLNVVQECFGMTL